MLKDFVSICELCEKRISHNGMKFFAASAGHFTKEDIYCAPDNFEMSSFHEPMTKLGYLEHQYEKSLIK